MSAHPTSGMNDDASVTPGLNGDQAADVVPAPAEPPVTQAELAYTKLLERFVMLDEAPGAWVNEPRLCEELGLGRTPVREALKRLEVDGFVQFFPRRGIRASSVEVGHLSDLYNFRYEVEPIAARFAAHTRGGSAAKQMRGLVSELESAGSLGPRALMHLDMRVHGALYAATGNPYLEASLVRTNLLATRIWCAVMDRIPAMDSHVGEHVAILDAVLGGDAEAAAARARAHVQEFEASVRAVLAR